MIKIGSTAIKKICIGSTPLKKVCVGSTVVYDSTPPDVPDTPTETSTYTINLSKVNASYMKYVLTPSFARDGKNAVVIAHDNVDDYMLKNTFENFVPNFPFTISGTNYYTARADTFARTADTTRTQYFVYIIRDSKVVAHGPVLANGTDIKIPDVKAPAQLKKNVIGILVQKQTPGDSKQSAQAYLGSLTIPTTSGDNIDEYSFDDGYLFMGNNLSAVDVIKPSGYIATIINSTDIPWINSTYDNCLIAGRINKTYTPTSISFNYRIYDNPVYITIVTWENYSSGNHNCSDMIPISNKILVTNSELVNIHVDLVTS